MADLMLAPRVRETCLTAGTGPLTLGGAPAGYFPFSAVGEGVAKAVPYLIEWGSGSGAGAEWGVGNLNAAGTVLARDWVQGHTPATLRAGPSTTPVDLPAGSKTVSLAVLDTMAVAVCPETAQAANPSPVADQDQALAVGIGARASGGLATALGSLAEALHDRAIVVGAGASTGPRAAHLVAGDGLVVEQCVTGDAAPGLPFVANGPCLFLTADQPYWIEMTAFACNAAVTQFRAIRRTIFVAGAGIVTQGADTVLVSSLATVPTVTLALGSVNADGRKPLVVTASSSGATAVTWRIFFRTLGL